jgi:hypothetical protein
VVTIEILGRDLFATFFHHYFSTSTWLLLLVAAVEVDFAAVIEVVEGTCFRLFAVLIASGGRGGFSGGRGGGRGGLGFGGGRGGRGGVDKRGGRGGGRGAPRGGRGGARGGAKVMIEPHRHAGILLIAASSPQVYSLHEARKTC